MVLKAEVRTAFSPQYVLNISDSLETFGLHMYKSLFDPRYQRCFNTCASFTRAVISGCNHACGYQDLATFPSKVKRDYISSISVALRGRRPMVLFQIIE